MEKQYKPVIHPNSQEVEPIFRVAAENSMNSEYERGIKKYGTTLFSFSGRSAYVDGMDEWVALGRYMTQLEMELEWYKEQYEELKFRLEGLEK